MSHSRIAAIGWLGLALACATPRAVASPAGGKAANARGMSLMAQKKWAAAEAEFKKAVAEDPSSVKAHYNLASAASRAHDADTALEELAWVGDRAAWDSEAKTAVDKAENDDDLKWVFDANDGLGIDGMKWTFPTDLVQPDDTAHLAHLLPDAERAKMVALLASTSGAHDAKCDPTDAKQGKILALPLRWGKVAKHTAVGALKDGVALVDPNGAVIARSEPLGCTGPGESQDQLATLVYEPGDPTDGATTKHLAPTHELQLLAVSYTNGGRREWQTNVAVFARRDKTFVKVFEGLVASSDANGAGHVWQSVLGNLVYSAPGEPKRQPFRWDPAKFKFVPFP